MTLSKQQKLEKLIQKAIDGGWRPNGKPEVPLLMRIYSEVVDFGYDEEDRLRDWRWTIDKLIFNHDFAKALWGETGRYYHYDQRTLVDESHREVYALDGWKHHLQQMIIADNPIDYAYAQVFGKEQE